MYGASGSMQTRAPRFGTVNTRVKMATKCRIRLQNPKLRDMQREIGEAAYRLRALVKVGSPQYWRLTNAMRGQCSLETLALMVELDARSGRGLLRDAIERTTGITPRSSSSTPDKP